MPHPWIAPVAALSLTLLGGAILLAACSPRAPIDNPTIPTAVPVVVTATPSAAPSAEPTATEAPSAPPPTGPGTIACGETRCRAGAEICCLGKQSRCVPAPAAPPDSGAAQDAYDVYVSAFHEAEARRKACGVGDFLACDDAGDCGDGQTCCEETYESETVSIFQGTCRPLRAGKVACARAEICSADDPRCSRKDNACAEGNVVGRCELPLALRKHPPCGKKPCAEGMTCVLDEDSNPTCEKGLFRNQVPLRNGVIECDRGRDCGEGESCYQNPQVPGRRCDYGLAGVDGLSEPAYCTGKEDCVYYCKFDETYIPSCHIEKKQRSGRCECLTPKR